MNSRTQITHFFDAPTNTLSYDVKDSVSTDCAVIESVLNFDYASGTISYDSADEIYEYIKGMGLHVRWLLETHVQADHLSAAP